MRILQAIAFAVIFFAAAPALACDCPQPDDKEAFGNYPLVFTARAEKTVAHIGEAYIETTVLTPEKFYKGSYTPNGQMMPAPQKSDCDFGHFEAGKRYLIFGGLTAESAIYLKTSICSPTRIIEDTFEPDPLHLVAPKYLEAPPAPIGDAELACDGDQHCMITKSECGCQNCPTPVNKTFGALYDTIQQARCATDRLLKCDVYCPGTLACMQKKCTWLKK